MEAGDRFLSWLIELSGCTVCIFLLAGECELVADRMAEETPRDIALSPELVTEISRWEGDGGRERRKAVMVT